MTMFEPHEYEAHASQWRSYSRWSITIILVVLSAAVLAMWASSCDQDITRIQSIQRQAAPAVVLDSPAGIGQPPAVIVTQPDNSLTNMLLLHSIMNSGPDTVVHEHYHAAPATQVVRGAPVTAPALTGAPSQSAASRVQFSAPVRANTPSAASRVTFSSPPVRSSPSSASRVSFSGGKR